MASRRPESNLGESTTYQVTGAAAGELDNISYILKGLKNVLTLVSAVYFWGFGLRK